MSESRRRRIIASVKRKRPPTGGGRERRMNTGLVLEGGAMRGLFTAGILDVMMEEAGEI